MPWAGGEGVQRRSQRLKVTGGKEGVMALTNMTLLHVNFARRMESLDLMIFENRLRDVIILPWKVFEWGQSFTAENPRRKSGGLWAAQRLTIRPYKLIKVRFIPSSPHHSADCLGQFKLCHPGTWPHLLRFT